MDAWIRWLTVISLSVAILSALGAFSWKILRHMARLSQLPIMVAEMNNRLNTIKEQIITSNRKLEVSNRWHAEHLMREHGMIVRNDSEGRD